jgi:hypothetical protein
MGKNAHNKTLSKNEIESIVYYLNYMAKHKLQKSE